MALITTQKPFPLTTFLLHSPLTQLFSTPEFQRRPQLPPPFAALQCLGSVCGLELLHPFDTLGLMKSAMVSPNQNLGYIFIISEVLIILKL